MLSDSIWLIKLLDKELIWLFAVSNLVATKEERLEQLRKKQGRDVEYYKDELMQDLKVDEEKAMKLNGKIDFTVY